MACLACDRIEQARRGENPWFIAEGRESIFVLHEHQAYAGWCVLLLKDHQEHLHKLPAARQARLMEDVAEVSGALARALPVRRINYECLGNVLAHVHWHVIPRYGPPQDPEPTRPVWVRTDAELQCGVSDVRRAELIEALRGAMRG